MLFYKNKTHNMKFKLMQGNNLELLKKLPDNSIDSVVSDPPYGISFMSKKWDYDVPSVEFWTEVYRVLKPGGHVLSFGGTRTYHRMVVNIEDAGFEIRDQIQWLYGSGFPKSLNIGKAVDKLEGNERIETGEGYIRGDKSTFDIGANGIKSGEYRVTKGKSEFEGWGTALKPANEPICLARKPLSEKSVAENVIKWKTGGINVDGCRITFNGDKPKECELVDFRGNGDQMNLGASGKERKIIEDKNYVPNDEGRFPANLILDEEAALMLDEQSGFSKTNCKKGVDINTEVKGGSAFPTSGYKKATIQSTINDSGGASRFFYIPKVSKKERNMGLDLLETKITPNSLGALGKKSLEGRLEDKDNPIISKNNHPTVKPVQLMSYLCRLITPEGGIVLDPFMGSGSTGISALLEGFRFCGMEMDEDYFKIAEARITNHEEYRQFLKKK